MKLLQRKTDKFLKDWKLTKKNSYKKNDGKRNEAVAPSFSVILLYAILAYYYKPIPRRPKVPCRCFLSTRFQR